MTTNNDLIERAVQASIDAGLAVDGEHGVASARVAARFVFDALASRSADSAGVGVKNVEAQGDVQWVNEPSGLSAATITHDDFSLVEVVKSPRTNSARLLTIHLTNEETGRRSDMSIDLTEDQAKAVASAFVRSLRRSRPCQADEGGMALA